MDRVLVVVRIKTDGLSAQLLPPPDKSEPSACWMEKLASIMEPMGSVRNAFRCCIFGSIEEVGSHLWQHQALWMRFYSDSAEERYDKVPFTELLEASADFSSGRYTKEVELEDDSFDGSGKVTVSLNLEAVRDEAGAASAALRPSMVEAFVLRVAGVGKTSMLIANPTRLAGAGAAGSRGLYLRCAGVEQPLRDLCTHSLVLVESWKEVPLALLELDVCVQVPSDSSRDFAEIPLDMSDLIAAAESGSSGGSRVAAQAKTTDVPALGEALLFNVSVQSFRWAGSTQQMEPGRTQDTELLVDGLSGDVRTWRVSIEVRSIRLISRSAKVFVAYSYGPLQQPRAFRTNPPTLARQHATVLLPHSFAAYTLASTRTDLHARLEDALSFEVWQRDVYRKDDLIGISDVAVAGVFDRPVQQSNSLPSMVKGFRVLDQVQDIIGTGEGAQKLGALRVLFFLEDLGPVEAPQPHTSAVCTGGDVIDEALVRHGSSADAHTGIGLTAELGTADAAALALRQSPAYSSAYELELWKRSEEDKFRSQLRSQEQEQRDRLEEEYQQREQARAKEFRQKQTDLRDVESRVRSKMAELQQREVAVVAAETRCSALQDEVKRRTDLAIQEYEDLSRRKVEDAQQALQLEKRKSRHLEGRISELESELTTVRQKLREVEEEFDERKRRLDQLPVVQIQHDLNRAQLELREATSKVEALTASRDHFRNKVEELCRRMLVAEAAVQAVPARSGGAGSVQATPPGPSHVSAQNTGPAAQQAALPDVAHALRRIQEDLGQLAREWTPAASAAASSLVQRSASPLALPKSPARASVMTTPPSVVAPRAQDHLVWLRSQREELLESGLYSESDPVLIALDQRIAEASRSVAF